MKSLSPVSICCLILSLLVLLPSCASEEAREAELRAGHMKGTELVRLFDASLSATYRSVWSNLERTGWRPVEKHRDAFEIVLQADREGQAGRRARLRLVRKDEVLTRVALRLDPPESEADSRRWLSVLLSEIEPSDAPPPEGDAFDAYEETPFKSRVE